MTPERWRQVTEAFHAALARDAAERRALLEEMCGGDAELRGEVDAMLAAHENAGAFDTASVLGEGIEPARLEPGTALGPYRIEAPIGAGGMGEVYRAHDARLERKVAVKVLPVRVASDPRWRERLDREARAVAALSHPNICPVFDVGQQDGIDYLVMEYLEGETLAQRLNKGPLPLEQALKRAVEIADALDKAHRQGIVHRDLKPANVMLTKGGARLLDFGLAKLRPFSTLAAIASPGTPPSGSLTGEGTIVGTLQYIAPEQLNGEEVDARTDVFALGAVLYEMVTGRKAFEGKSPASVVAAILEREPPAISMLQPMSPPALDHLVRTCLAKDPDQRWQSAADVGRSLAWILGAGSQPSAAATRRAANSRLPWLAALALAVMAAVSGVAWFRSTRTASPLVQGALTAPPRVALSPRGGFALSPDGRFLAFIARDGDGVSRLWVRALADREARPLAGTEGAMAVPPFWSPDGRHIGFFASQALKRVPAGGGAVQHLAAPTVEPKGGTWSPDGRIVYVPDYRTGLYMLPATGGTAEGLTALDTGRDELSHRWPQFLPDGRSLLFLVQTAEAGADDDRSRVEVLDANGRHEVLKVNSSAAYAPPGWLLFWREGAIRAQELDLERQQLRGEARLVADGVGLTLSEWATFTVSGEGTLVYASAVPWRLEWRERSGRVLSVPAPEGQYSYAALSPDGRRVAYVADNITVWTRDLVRGTGTRLTFRAVDHYSPVWSPDGEWLAYAVESATAAGSEIRRRRSSGLGEEQVLCASPKVIRHISWSPDGRWIAYDDGEDISLLDLQSRAVRTRVGGRGLDAYPRFSPDGRWLAYSSDESGREEVYVEPAFEGAARWQVSRAGGFEPRWHAAGRELLFLGLDGALLAAKIDLGEKPDFAPPEPLFPLLGAKPGTAYDIAPDGRILVRARRPEGDNDTFRLVLNWPRLLDQPTGR